MHFWANDDALKLAKGLREALDKTASASRWPHRRDGDTSRDAIGRP